MVGSWSLVLADCPPDYPDCITRRVRLGLFSLTASQSVWRVGTVPAAAIVTSDTRPDLLYRYYAYTLHTQIIPLTPPTTQPEHSQRHILPISRMVDKKLLIFPQANINNNGVFRTSTSNIKIILKN